MRFALLLLIFILLPAMAPAAIGLIAPSDDIVGPGENPAITLQLGVFAPDSAELPVIPGPKRFAVQHLGEQTDLLPALKFAPGSDAKVLRGAAASHAGFTGKRPGDYTFSLESLPRLDTAAEEFTVFLAKMCVNVGGLEEGWDEPVGLEAEIVPLSRPYGLWSGNLFSGQVLLDGEQAPYAEISVVFLGPDPAIPLTPAVPAGPYLVQKVRADASGIFHYAMPRAGWWGFAATIEANRTVKKDGTDWPVTLVSSYWVQTRNFP